MKAEFRFLRTHGGVTRFARVAVVSELAEGWTITLSYAPEEPAPIHGDAVREGISRATAEQERLKGPRYRIDVHALAESVVDTSADAVECAATVAAWKSFGRDEAAAVVYFGDGRWRVRFAREEAMKEVHADFNDIAADGSLPLTCAGSMSSIATLPGGLEEGEEVWFADGELCARGRVFRRSDGSWEGRSQWKFLPALASR